MSKAIKVEDHIYTSLDRLRVGRSTFSDVIKELLQARQTTMEAMSMLEGQLKYREWQRQEYEKAAAGKGG